MQNTNKNKNKLICLISLFLGSTSDTHTDLQIFAKGGWDDITISDEYKLHSVIDVEGQSRMHCGGSNYYDSSCLIQQNWFCECPLIPTVSTTSMPIPEISMINNTDIGDGDGDGDEEREKTGYIVGGILVGLCVIAFIGVVYWYCCVHHKPVDPNDEMDDNDNIDGNVVNKGSNTKTGYQAVADDDKNIEQEEKEEKHDEIANDKKKENIKKTTTDKNVDENEAYTD